MALDLGGLYSWVPSFVLLKRQVLLSGMMMVLETVVANSVPVLQSSEESPVAFIVNGLHRFGRKKTYEQWCGDGTATVEGHGHGVGVSF